MLMRPYFACSIAVALSILVGCDRDLGECNLDGQTSEPDRRPIPGPAALDIAFRESDGVPMYEGQALVQSSCGNAQFCHSPAATGGQRFGVPAGLNFDVSLACTDESVDPTCANLEPCEGASVESAYCDRLQRLEHNRGTLVSWAGHSISQIRDGTMPPGAAGQSVRDTRTWLRDDRVTPLPEFGTGEAQEIIRNWLACASPVVARTELAPNPDLELTPCASIEGETCVFSGSPADLPDPTWSSIYASVMFQQCVVCHGPPNDNTDQNPSNPTGNIPGGASPEGLAALNMTGSDTTDTSNWAFESHPALVNAPASLAGECGGEGRINVIPGDAAGSLMIQKMLGIQDCGGQMPLVGNLVAPSVVSVIEQWIDDGAANN